jgi:hypothetical protein
VTWLVRLYPPAWRRRYGRELAALIATQPASFGTAIDLIAGALDAWLYPQASAAAAAPDSGGGDTVIAKMLQLRCAGYGQASTKQDTLKGAALVIGGTLAVMLAIMWAMTAYPKNPYLESLLLMSWGVPTILSQRYTSLKGRPALVQTVIMGGQAVVIIGIALAAGWASS